MQSSVNVHNELTVIQDVHPREASAELAAACAPAGHVAGTTARTADGAALQLLARVAAVYLLRKASSGQQLSVSHKSRSTMSADAAECDAYSLPQQLLPVPDDASDERLQAIRINEKAWANGTNIPYFMFQGPAGDMDVVRQVFQEYRDLGIGLTFREV